MRYSPESEHYIRLFSEKKASMRQSDISRAVSAQEFGYEKASMDISSINPAIAALGVGIPAYMLGKSSGRDEEKSNRAKYLATGAAAGIALPKLLGMLTPSMLSSLDSADVLKLKEKD